MCQTWNDDFTQMYDLKVHPLFWKETKKQNLKGTLKYIYCGIYKVYLNICRYHHAGWQARHYCPPQWVLIDLGGEATKSLHFVKVNFCFCSSPHFSQQGVTCKERKQSIIIKLRDNAACIHKFLVQDLTLYFSTTP